VQHKEFLRLIRSRENICTLENAVHITSRLFPEGLKVFWHFCQTGEGFEDASDHKNVQTSELLVKELLCYCVLDVFTQVKKKGTMTNIVQKTVIPSFLSIVHTLPF
jgi:5-methylcytosine-specific restriction endonuclease McrBC regulatory subunit McrC